MNATTELVAEVLLAAAPSNVRRQYATHRLTQYPFAMAVVLAQVQWYPGVEFDYLAVEERVAWLDAVETGNAVVALDRSRDVCRRHDRLRLACGIAKACAGHIFTISPEPPPKLYAFCESG